MHSRTTSALYKLLTYLLTHIICYYYYIRLTAFFSSRHQKGKPFWILLEQEIMGESGISWTICKSVAPRCRQITTPVPHHSVFTGRMPFMPPNQAQTCRPFTTGDTVAVKLKVKITHIFCYIFLLSSVAGDSSDVL